MSQIKTIRKILIIGIGVIFLILLFLKQQPVTKPINKTDPTPTQFQSNLLPYQKSPNQISWGINDIKIDPTLTVYKVLGEANTTEIGNKMSQNLGFNNSKLDNSSLTVFENETDKSTLEINKTENKISYYKNLLLNPIPIVSQKLEVEQIKNIFLKLVNQNLNLSGLNISINNVEYEEIINPRFVSSSKENSQIVKINAYYAIKNYPILTDKGFPIVARFSWDGTLIKLDVDLLSSIIAKQDDYPTFNFDEIKALPINNFKIINIDGGAQYDLTNFEDKAPEEVNINQTYIAYLDVDNYPLLRPYLICLGKGILDTGPATITLAVPLLKE
ncbi:MAG: hypothetical protein Q8P53_02995 [Candidatus Shapirobacteria bacterium]|nr:hypothetical protein [Candidatus Shapirobacteria bacterium]